MKAFLHLRTLALLVAGLMAASPRAGAQFVLSVTSSASSILVGNSLTYTINMTNLTAGSSYVFVTNTFPAAAQLLGASITFLPLGSGNIITNANGFSFLIMLASGAPAQMTVLAAPTQAGFFTNMVTVFVSGVTNFTTNVVIQVTNSVVPQADLGVAITGPAQAVITNDWMTYGVMATNLGPSVATNVVLTNTLPPGVVLKSVSSQSYTVANSNLIFNLRTLANGGSTNFQFTIQPTNAGVLTLFASIGSTNVLDLNPTNNSASNNITVANYLPGQLEAVTNSSQNPDVVSGLTEQSILLTNIGTTNVPAARIVVTGLTNRLFNAVGTNNGNPFVYYSAPLAAGQSVNLLLQFYPRTLFHFTNGQLHAFAVPVPNWTPPPAMGISTNLNLTRIVKLNNGWMLIEWPAITNQTYTVVYSDNFLFSNAMIAPPSIVAQANWVQWIDYGPPTTVSAPKDASARFYRVFLNQ